MRLNPKIIRRLARDLVGGVNVQPELGVFVNKAGDVSVNLEALGDRDDCDLHDTRSDWDAIIFPDDCELDFYVYARDYVGGEQQLRDNLGVLVRGGRIVGCHIVGDRNVWREVKP